MPLTGKIIEFGGGNNPQYHPNYDIREGNGVDIVADLNKPLTMIEDGSVDGVYSAYAIEHISYRNLKQFVNEIARILKKNGKAQIITANLKEQARVIASTDHWEGDYENRLLFGDQDYPENSHKCGMSPEYAQRLFKEAGLESEVYVHPNCKTDMIIEAVKAGMNRFGWIEQHLIGKNVIDIGCADAPCTSNHPNCHWVDSEPYEKLADVSRKSGREPFPRDRFAQCTAEHIPFGNKEFDIALVSEVLEHVKDPIEVLLEANRVGKQIIITVPNEYCWDEKWLPFQNESHVRYYTQRILEDDIKKAGFTEYKIEQLEYDGWSFFTAVIEGIETVREQTIPFVSTSMVELGHPVLDEKIAAESGASHIVSNDKLKIAILSTPFITTPPAGYGGLERVVYDIAVGIGKLGHDVTVFAANGSKVDGCKVFEFGPPTNSTQVDWLKCEQAAMANMKDELIQNDYDIIHGNNWFGLEYGLALNPGVSGMPAKHGYKARCHTHHGGLNQEWWCKSKPPFKLNMIAISKWMQAVYKQQGIESRPIYNPIDLEKYQYQEKKGDRMVFVGRIDTFKQPHIAIEVAKKTGIGLDIIGGTFVQDVRYLDQIKAACDGKLIRFIENPPQDEKVRLMQNAMCLLFPSKMGEPFGLVAAESMACGTPVIALKDGAIAEVVAHNVTGFMCDDEQAIIRALKKVNDIDPKKCRDRVEKMFSREVIAQQYLDAYIDILSGKEW